MGNTSNRIQTHLINKTEKNSPRTSDNLPK